MPFRSTAAHRPFGMGLVAAIGALALVVTAAVVLWPTGRNAATGSPHGVLSDYASEPAPLWTIDQESMPGLVGNGDISIDGSDGGDLLISYSAGIRRAYLLVDGDTGRAHWDTPVNVGFGACAFNERGEIGCAMTSATGSTDGFYLVDRDSGRPEHRSDESDTKELVGLAGDFVHVNASGYQVSRRTSAGETAWSRTFAASAAVTVDEGVLLVQTTDGRRFVLDPKTGDDVISCEDCEVATFPEAVVVEHDAAGREGLTFHPVRSGEVEEDPVKEIDGMRLVPGPSTLAVATTASDQTLADHGRFQIFDPATGDAVWEIADKELSKAHARPCGALVSFARKDRSRAFFALADGARIGDLAPPATDEPDANLDLLECVGASEDNAVFANANQITAYRPATGTLAWTLPVGVGGVVANIDGRIVVREGSTVTVYRPN